MDKRINKNDALKGYLLLFVALQWIDLAVISFNFLRNIRGYYLMILTGGSPGVYSFAIIGLSLLNIILPALIIFYFLKRNRTFIKIYVVSSICSIIYMLLLIIYMLYFIVVAPPYPYEGIYGFFDITNSVLGIIYNIVMLYFWLNYFKNAAEARVYLKSKPGNFKKKAKKKGNLKVIK